MKRSSLGPDTHAEGLELVEVVDKNDTPLLVMPLAEAHRQELMHRSVLVLVHDTENRVYLQRRSKSKALFPGFWDLSTTGHVKAGESREGAAQRELREELGLEADRLKLLYSVPADKGNGWEHVTVFSAGRAEKPRPNPDEVMEGAFHDPEELAFLVEHFSEMLTPALLFAWERSLIFQPVQD